MYKKTIIAILVAVLIFGLGVLVGMKVGSKPADAPAPTAQDNPTVANTPVMPAVDIVSASGTAQKISDGTISLRLSPSNPLALESGYALTVRTGADTKVYWIVRKDPAQFQQEMADFQKKMRGEAGSEEGASSQTMATPPMSYDRKDATLSDIKEGRTVTVVSMENIRGKQEFLAAEILIVLESAPLPTPTTPAQ